MSRLQLLSLPRRAGRWLRRTRFRTQLVLIVSVAILLLALVSSLLNTWAASQRTQDYLVRQGLQITGALARQSTLALLYHAPQNAETEVTATLAFPDVRYVEIVDVSRETLLARAKDTAPGYQPPAGHKEALPGAAHPRLAWENDAEWGFVAPAYAGVEEASPFEMHERKPFLLGYVVVVVSKEGVHALAASLQRVNLGVTLSFAVLLLAVLGVTVQRLIRPLNSLSGLMRRGEAGEAGLRASPTGPRDITDMATAFNKMMAVLEEREAELQHSRDRAVHTAQMKTQFAATVSHEVRTPLNGVVGMLDLLREMPLEAKPRECVEVAWNSAHALIELINGILDFSKLEAGKLELEEINFDVRELAEGVVELLARQAQQKGLEIGYVLDPAMPARIRGDSLRVRQVLINLVSNAVKFTERGEVALRLSFGTGAGGDGGEGGEGLLRVEVSDTGIGMDEATVQHVFESFAQADPSTTRKYGGTGLGLTISKHLVALMRGEIGVSSAPGRGSTFWFTVPVGAVAATPVLPPPVSGTVLLLSRSQVLRQFVELELRALGLACQMTGSAEEAGQHLRRAAQQGQAFRLVLVDGDALRGDGAALHRLREHSSAPVLLLDRRLPTAGSASDAGLTVAKPLRHGSFAAAVSPLLSGHPLPAQAAVPVPAAAGPVLAGRTFRVLVVEDNRTNQMVAGAMLARLGCDCTFAGNGLEAVAAAQAARFDLILMDCSMPEMDGFDATRQIRRDEAATGGHTPIVAMTANVQSGDEEACLAAGMDDYLAKPVTLATLKQKLGDWLVTGHAGDHSG